MLWESRFFPYVAIFFGPLRFSNFLKWLLEDFFIVQKMFVTILFTIKNWSRVNQPLYEGTNYCQLV